MAFNFADLFFRNVWIIAKIFLADTGALNSTLTHLVVNWQVLRQSAVWHLLMLNRYAYSCDVFAWSVQYFAISKLWINVIIHHTVRATIWVWGLTIATTAQDHVMALLGIALTAVCRVRLGQLFRKVCLSITHKRWCIIDWRSCPKMSLQWNTVPIPQ